MDLWTPRRPTPALEGLQIHEATTRFSVVLRAGKHRIPIPGRAVLHIEVSEGCEACGVVAVGPVEGQDPDPAIREVRFEFTRPLVIQNPVEVLIHLYRRFGDSSLSDRLDTLPPPWNEWVRSHAGSMRGRLSGLAQAPVEVTLSGVRAETRLGTGEARVLRPAFSGRVGLAGGVSWPFSGVVLPTAVLPAFHASLDALLAGDIVASDAGPGASLESATLARALWNLMAHLDADVQARVTLPLVAWEAETPDRTRLRAQARFADPRVLVHARVRANRSRSRLDVLPSSVEVRAEDPPYRSARVEVQGGIQPVFRGSRPVALSRATLSFRLPPADPGPEVAAMVEKTHPLTRGGLRLAGRVSQEDLRGRLVVSRDRTGWAVRPAGHGVRATLRIEAVEPQVVWGHDDTLRLALDQARVTLRLVPSRTGWWIGASASADVTLTGTTRLSPLPEVRVLDPVLRTDIAVRLEGHGVYRSPVAEHRGPTTSVTIHALLKRLIAELDGRRLTIPQGAIVTASWDLGDLSGDFSRRAVRFSWDLRGRVPVLSGYGRATPLLDDALLEGELNVHVSPGGRLSFGGERSGLYGVSFFNALLDPASEPRHLLDVLMSDEAMGHVIAALDVFNPDLARGAERLRRWVRDSRERLRFVKKPGDVIPPDQLARVLSVLLAGHDGWTARLLPVVRSVVEGRGIPMTAMAAILREVPALDGHGYEVGGVLRWLDLVLKAGEPLPPPNPVQAEPLATDPALAWAREGFPSAAEIEKAAEGPVPSPWEQERIARAAPRMTLKQVEWLLHRVHRRWEPQWVRFLERVRAVKRRIEEISREGYGGLAHAGQAARIASLIGDAVGPLPALGEAQDSRPPCALGPSDIAVLLQVGLSQARQGTQTQVNNRLLMECLRSQPRELTREVLIEMGHQDDSALAGVLFAFLSQDQDRMAAPLDLPAFLQERLGLPVPRQEDFLAGGLRARESYFEALATLAARIMEEAAPLFARRAHIQEVRHAPPGPPRVRGRAATLQREARRAISAADRLAGRLCLSAREGEASRNRARDAYETAFSACAEFLREVPDGFTLPWFRAFWARNEEALRVLSVVRAYEEDQDEVRRFLRVTAGLQDSRDREDLVDPVIAALWARPEDREALRADPLVRLLLPVPEGHLAFTIVACMGVITDGERGRELEDAFRRLQQRRGVHVIRAHTGLFRPLEFNAAAVIQAIEKAKTPYGLLGYSQGCANALMAEHLLRSGTPEERRLLDGLMGRNLLFLAANGSVHGTSGERKFIQAMIEGERFLKHYQATLSREAVTLFFRVLKATLDSPGFLKTVAGAHSLTLERAAALHRDGQFRCDVPTSVTRGVASLDRLPEALTYLYHCHSRLLPGAEHDSQVPADEAVGRATRVRNACTEAFARCDMGSLPLALHHWAPVTAEVERVTTGLDRERAVYQAPKDLLVFPWVEVHTRFGRIAYNRVVADQDTRS